MFQSFSHLSHSSFLPFSTGTTARSILSELISTSSSIIPKPNASNPMLSLLESRSLLLLSPQELEPLLEFAIESLPEEAELVRNGDERVLKKLIGEVMKKGKGRTDGRKVEEGFRRILMSWKE